MIQRILTGALFLLVGSYLTFVRDPEENPPLAALVRVAGAMSLLAGIVTFLTLILYQGDEEDLGSAENLFRSPLWQSMPTYWWENLAVSFYLGVMTLVAAWDLSGTPALAQFLGAIAVFFTFRHVSVANRLEEAQDRSDVKTVDCYKKLTHFLVIKEILWVAVFSLTGAWTALAGIPIFLFYPVWRRYYRHVHPKESVT